MDTVECLGAFAGAGEGFSFGDCASVRLFNPTWWNV